MNKEGILRNMSIVCFPVILDYTHSQKWFNGFPFGAMIVIYVSHVFLLFLIYIYIYHRTIQFSHVLVFCIF